MQHPLIPPKPARWWIVTALDMATEVLLIAVPTILVSRVMIHTRAKVLVCLAFTSRLPLIAFTAIHSVYIERAREASDRAFAYVDVVLWIQILIAWSLISASIPSFKAFMNPFDAIADEGMFANNSGPRSDINGAYLMMGRANPNKGASGNRSNMRDKSGNSNSSGLGRLRPEKVEQRATVSTQQRSSAAEDEESDSLHSQADIIRRDVRWDISYDQAKDV